MLDLVLFALLPLLTCATKDSLHIDAPFYFILLDKCCVK